MSDHDVYLLFGGAGVLFVVMVILWAIGPKKK